MRNQKSEQLERNCVNIDIAELQVSIPIVIVAEVRIMTFFLGFSIQLRVSSDANLLTKQLIILLQRLLLIDYLNELFFEVGEKSGSLVQGLLVILSVPPKLSGGEDGNNF